MRKRSEVSLANLKPFPKGKSGNPAGRKQAGAYVSEEWNSLMHAKTPRAKLQAILADPNESPARVIAAGEMLQAMERPDSADYEPVTAGSMTLQDLRRSGVATRAVKRIKTHTQYAEGEVVGITRDIELHDRAGAAVDRIMDRTVGRASQAVDITSQGEAIMALVGVDIDKI